MYLQFAFRNIFRNRLRSLITLASIAFGCASLIVAGGFIEDMLVQLRESYIHAHLGHVQMYKRGYLRYGASRPHDFMIPELARVARLTSSLPHVRTVTPRLEFPGMLSVGEASASFLAQGVDPAGEKTVCTFMAFDQGVPLEPEDGYRVILGKGLAGSVSAKLGDTVTLVTHTRSGGLNGVDLSVGGIFYTSSKAFDDRALRLPLRVAQELLRTDSAQTLVVVLDETRNTDPVMRELERMFHESGLDIELRPWYNMADFYTNMANTIKRQFLVLQFIIVVIVILSVFNTLNMSVLERIGEVGTLMALGINKAGVTWLFFLEGILLGVIGCALGAVSAFAASELISYFGIPMPPPPGMTVGWTARIMHAPSIYASALALSMTTTIASSVYPAFRAAGLEVAEALRHNV